MNTKQAQDLQPGDTIKTYKGWSPIETVEIIEDETGYRHVGIDFWDTGKLIYAAEDLDAEIEVWSES